jgi:hypothetical protein
MEIDNVMLQPQYTMLDSQNPEREKINGWTNPRTGEFVALADAETHIVYELWNNREFHDECIEWYFSSWNKEGM